MAVKFSEFSIGTIGADLEIVGFDSATPQNVQVSYSDIKTDILADTGLASYANSSLFPPTGATGLLYLDLSTAYIYYWDGVNYIQVSAPPPAAVTGSVGLFNYYNFI